MKSSKTDKAIEIIKGAARYLLRRLAAFCENVGIRSTITRLMKKNVNIIEKASK